MQPHPSLPNGLVPPLGWLRARRDALGMTSRQLARRLNVSQPAVTQMEKSESNGVIRLDTLRRAADALDCDLVYSLVPRRPVEETVLAQAMSGALRDMAVVDRTMRLEAQGIGTAQIDKRVLAYARRLIDRGDVWERD